MNISQAHLNLCKKKTQSMNFFAKKNNKNVQMNKKFVARQRFSSDILPYYLGPFCSIS